MFLIEFEGLNRSPQNFDLPYFTSILFSKRLDLDRFMLLLTSIY